MTTVTFDTLKFAGLLRESGFDEKQSTGLANAIQEVQASSLNGLGLQLATKADVAKMERDFSMQILELKRDIKESEYRITIRLGALVVAAVGFLKYFPNIH